MKLPKTIRLPIPGDLCPALDEKHGKAWAAITKTKPFKVLAIERMSGGIFTFAKHRTTIKAYLASYNGLVVSGKVNLKGRMFNFKESELKRKQP